jgi:hypothetical protein
MTMAASSLEHSDETPPTLFKGHGTRALGPSDSSDSGSDLIGGPGLNRDDGLLQPPGTTSDPDVDGIGATAGPDIGDPNLDSDSDRYGTGERAAAGRDSTLPTDTVLRGTNDEVIDPESIDVEAAETERIDAEPRSDNEDDYADPPERTYARANGKPETMHGDVPAFDRANREDLPRERHPHDD